MAHPAEHPVRAHGLRTHLEWQVSYRLSAPLIYLKGELDHDSVSQLRPVIDDELRESPEALLLDLSELGYMDSGGRSLMFDGGRRMEPPRWGGMVAPNPGVERLLQMTGLAESPSVRIFPDQAAAAASFADE